MFRYSRGIRRTYADQILIYSICVNFRKLDAVAQGFILDFCRDASSGHETALLRLLLDTESPQAIMASEHIASFTTLWRAKKRFYENFPLGVFIGGVLEGGSDR